jgi:hypothetical protein
MALLWHATVTLRRWTAPPTDDQLAALAAALPGFGVVVDDGAARVTVQMSFTAQSARTACDAAARAARTAWAQTLSGTPEITGIQVLTDEDWNTAIVGPGPQDLIGKSEIAQLLHVSPQRVDELSRTHADFPAPVAAPKMGPVYTRASVDVFNDGWERRRTGRPRKNAAATG